MKYKFKYKNMKDWFWKTKTVVGHRYDESSNSMILYYENGTINKIPDWKNCYMKLGIDWVLANKKVMEKESGQTVPLEPGIGEK